MIEALTLFVLIPIVLPMVFMMAICTIARR